MAIKSLGLETSALRMYVFFATVRTMPCLVLQQRSANFLSTTCILNRCGIGCVAVTRNGIDVAREGYLIWIAMMKACRAKGPVATTMLHKCCGNTQLALTLIAEGMNHKDKAVTAQAETLLREALLVRSGVYGGNACVKCCELSRLKPAASWLDLVLT